MVPAGILPSSKCCFHQSFGRCVGAGAGAGVGMSVGMSMGMSVGLGVVSELHAAPSPRSQQFVVSHGVTKVLPFLTVQVWTSQRAGGSVPEIEL